MADKPKCRLCGKTDDMTIRNYSVKQNKVYWYCRACGIETKVAFR